MADVLLALCIPLTLFASGLYAVCDSWWRRRRRGAVQPRHLYPGVCSYVYAYEHPRAHAGARLAERDMLTAAEEIVDEAYAKLAWLYDGACAGPDAGANGDTSADVGAEPSADPVSADSTADHGPSRPAPARTVTRPPEH